MKESEQNLNWEILKQSAQLADIIKISHEKPCVIFKHSSKCTISQMALFQLEEDWKFDKTDVVPYFLDIFTNKGLTIEIADQFKVNHESPQLLLIKKGVCTYDAAHLEITYEELEECMEDTIWDF